MSTQLILYPQDHKGYTSSSIALNEYFVDGQNFSQVNASSTTVVTQPTAVQSAINSIAPTGITNTWYRYYAGSGGGVSQSGSKLQFVVTTIGDYGIMQQLSNLTVGAVYVVSIDYSLQTGTGITAYIYSGTVLQSTHPLAPPVVGQFTTFNFTAVTTSQFIVFNQHYFSSSSVNEFSSISITKQSQPTVEILGDGQVICDLYQEEDIPLTLSVDDFKNVAEKVQSYSKDFNLPATKRNNQIFNNMFEITRADDGLIFNPYVQTKCVLKQDGFILFEGYLRMIDIKEKEGEISYNVNLFSEVIALADVLKDLTFSNLDLSELKHLYNKTEIKRSWNESPDASITYLNPSTSGFRQTYDTLRYPFIDWTHQYIVGGTNPVSNNATTGNPELTSLTQAFRPCIQVKYLIDRIFADSGLNWTSNFFDSTDFGKLYMDFNWGSDLAPFTVDDTGEGRLASNLTVALTYSTIQTNDNTFGPNFGYSAGVFTALLDDQAYYMDYTWAFSVTGTGPWTIDYRWEMVKGGVTSYIDIQQSTGVDDSTWFSGMHSTFSQTLNAGDTLRPQVKSPEAVSHSILIQSMDPIFGTLGVNYSGTSAQSMTNSSFLQTLRGELGQWDFLKGIMTMFNLVSLVDESNPDSILIEPYADIFITNPNSTRLDWTDKVDVSQMELKPLTDLNKRTIFKFVEDDDDYVFNVMKRAQSGHLYGSLEYSASGFTILEGTEEIIAEPFAATVSKPIDSEFPTFIVPSIYAMNDDGTEGFDNSPRIFYNNGIKNTGASYYIPEANTLASENQEYFLQFSHLSDIPTIVSSPPAGTDTRDFVFTSSQLVTPVGTPPVDNLFNTYWLPYFNELYNADTRTMTLKVNLSPADVASFKFYDTVMIKNRAFRVNKIEYKPNSLAKVEFILMP